MLWVAWAKSSLPAGFSVGIFKTSALPMAPHKAGWHRQSTSIRACAVKQSMQP